MNKKLAGLIGGLAGSVTTTVLHEVLRRRVSDAPRLDKLGEEALDKAVTSVNGKHLPEGQRYAFSMAGDLIANTLYYSTTAMKPGTAVLTGTVLGATAGLGAVNLPSRLGLNAATTSATSNRKLYTIALYTIGGLVAGLVVKRLTRISNPG